MYVDVGFFLRSCNNPWRLLRVGLYCKPVYVECACVQGKYCIAPTSSIVSIWCRWVSRGVNSSMLMSNMSFEYYIFKVRKYLFHAPARLTSHFPFRCQGYRATALLLLFKKMALPSSASAMAANWKRIVLSSWSRVIEIKTFAHLILCKQYNILYLIYMKTRKMACVFWSVHTRKVKINSIFRTLKPRGPGIAVLMLHVVRVARITQIVDSFWSVRFWTVCHSSKEHYTSGLNNKHCPANF